ncbi:hypothetical protein FOXB_11719, partial [Fusarium oxysporum f. sp. conglutinans Fo5176]
ESPIFSKAARRKEAQD